MMGEQWSLMGYRKVLSKWVSGFEKNAKYI